MGARCRNDGERFFCVLYPRYLSPHICIMDTLKAAPKQHIRLHSGYVSFAGQDLRFDEENGIIYDVVMVQEGPAKGHGVHLEAEFIEAVIAYDKRYFRNTGLKARFGHPGASSETMGTQLGRFLDFRTREKDGKMQGIANLHLLASADKSPSHPNMREWVMSMAKEDPDFIMSSIVFEGSGYYQREESGRKKRMKFDDFGYPTNHDPDKEIYVEFDANAGAKHYYTDLVEQGAATDSLYSMSVNPHLFVSQAEQFLQDHPHILKFIAEHPDKVAQFFQRLGINIISPSQTPPPMSGNKTSFLSALLGSANKSPEQLAAEQFDAALTERFAEVQAENQRLSAQVTALQTEATALRDALTALAARVEKVEATPIAPPTGGDTPPAGGGEKERAYGQGDINARWRQRKAQ